MEFVASDKVATIIGGYQPKVSSRLMEVRQLIIDLAREEGVERLVETTKWGEPSYLTKNGSTIRMDWKAKTPDKYYLFFICSTELVKTFRWVFGEEFQFEGNRAIVLNLDDELPKAPLSKCIQLALAYHRLKHLPMLGQ